MPRPKSPLDWIDPQLASVVDEPPHGDEWLHEHKFDGYRILAFRQKSSLKLFSRNRLDWSERFSFLQEELLSIPASSFILDGEVCAIDKRGASSFSLLQQYRSLPVKSLEFAYYVFDLLFCDGKDLRSLPLEKRKELLHALVSKKGAKFLRYSDHSLRGGGSALELACKKGWEGIISKLKTSPYQSGRSRAWLKSKCDHSEEFLIAGFSPMKNASEKIGALLLAQRISKADFSHYCGKVGTGFSDADRIALFHLLNRDRIAALKLDNPKAAPRDAIWTKPLYVAEIGYTEWTAAGLLRHPRFIGIREDKAGKDTPIFKRRALL